MLQDLFQRDIIDTSMETFGRKGNLGVKMDSKQPSISSSTQRPIRVKVSRSIFDDIIATSHCLCNDESISRIELTRTI